MNSISEISEVSYLPVPPAEILGFHIERPRPGDSSNVYELSIIGWVVTAKEPASAMELKGSGIARRFSLNGQRPDLIHQFGDASPECRLGFRAQFSALRLPTQFQLTLSVIFGEGNPVPIARIRGCRRPLDSKVQPRIQPIMLNCLGRSGSTWVTHLLGQHPEIITYGSFQLEPRLAGYWMDVLGTLSEPASYTQALQPEVTGDEWWIGKNRRTTLSLEPIDSDLAAWLGGSAIESLAAFCMGRVEAFYQRAAESQGKEGARFFAERSYGVGTFAPQIVRELYAGAREVYLVRDFRDVFSSMRTFKGSSLPRRHLAKSDAEYVRNQLREYVAGLYRSWQARKDSAFLLRYEDLVRHPKATLTSLLEFIGVESGPHIVERVITSARMARSDRQDRHKTTTDPLSSVGRWVHELEPDVRQAFEERYVDILSEFGYSIDMVETAEPVP